MADEGTQDEKAAAKADHEPPAGAETSATWTGAGASIDYTASGTWIVLRKKERPAAEIFSVSYIAHLDRERPVTFIFNGGPGASSAYLHMGAVGPSRVAGQPRRDPSSQAFGGRYLSGRPLKYSAYFREGDITRAANLVACRRSPRIRWC
jgi:carboxypeptidase C (cathepsin A)